MADDAAAKQMATLRNAEEPERAVATAEAAAAETAGLKAVEAACLVEVIEHLEPDRLNRVAANLFQRLKPQTLILTTPNREYNAVWESLPAGKFRHPDHRFEWTRAEFEQWAGQVKDDYEVSIEGIGEPPPDYGCPTQMAVFTR